MEELQNHENMLKEAALGNNVEILGRLLRQDPLVLEKATLNSQDLNPLHVAAMFGYVEFVRAVISASPDLCLAGDRFGRIPLHLAIIKGKLDAVEELVRARPISARERINGGGNALHLCVKYNQLEILKFLVQSIKDDDFANWKDDDGMTILHLAICDKQNETIKFLIQEKVVEVNIKNANGSTPLDLFRQAEDNSDIGLILQQSGARRGRDIGSSVLAENIGIGSPGSAGNSPQEASGNKPEKQGNEWLSRKRDTVMLVASLIATMAFQAGVNPAGGVWQDDNGHVAGTAVQAGKNPEYYKNFVRTNTVALVSSLSTILFLISGLPFRKKFFLWALMVIMWLTVTAIALTYGISIMMVTPQSQKSNLSEVIRTAVTVWCGVMALMLLGNTIRLLNRWFRGRPCGFCLFPELKRQRIYRGHEQSNGNQGSVHHV